MTLYCVNITASVFNKNYYIKANSNNEAVAVALAELGNVASKITIKTELLCDVKNIIDYNEYTKK